jgi:CDP-diacylglycerol---glycerol-3-phosphate 3-phosphatidyltransferase
MASIYDLKPRFQAALRPALGWLVERGATPNAITLAAITGSLAAGIGLVFARERPALLLILPLWLLARMALNALDGMMAREHHMATPLGAVLNELGDVVSDLAIYLPLAMVSDSARWPVVAFAFGAVLSEFAGVLGVALGSTRRYEGPMGKSDRAFVVGALGILTVWRPAFTALWSWIFIVAAVLTLLTCWNRIRRALAEPVAARERRP